MSSKKNAADPFDLDLERDMPLSAEAIEALERARNLKPLSAEDYQLWVELVEKHHGRPERINSESDEPFTL